jgi:hypothetical protein
MFNIHGGVRQGYNIAPTLFNLYLDFVAKRALAALDAEVGVRVAFKHADKQLFANAQQMDSITWISLLFYANNMVLIAESIDQVSATLRQLKVETQQWGLTIRVPKTKLMCVCVCRGQGTTPPRHGLVGGGDGMGF